ncbi:hypothetical protein BX666DRAFT_767741 [Dichotomocladium elegans]|nr:hypothetical protein BX666DRAFT_767741 [Dichotomocladium elegans]
MDEGFGSVLIYPQLSPFLFMPFLRTFLSRVKHDSVLKMVDTRQTLQCPIPELEEWICDKTRKDGIRMGDTVNFYGPSGGGKTWAVSVMADQELAHSLRSVVVFDLDGRWSTILPDRPRFHLFQPTTPTQWFAAAYCFEEWLYEHSQELVSLVIVDGIMHNTFDDNLARVFKELQQRWKFCLMTTSIGYVQASNPGLFQYDYCLHVAKEDENVKLKMIWPVVSSGLLFPVPNRLLS